KPQPPVVRSPSSPGLLQCGSLAGPMAHEPAGPIAPTIRRRKARQTRTAQTFESVSIPGTYQIEGDLRPLIWRQGDVGGLRSIGLQDVRIRILRPLAVVEGVNQVLAGGKPIEGEAVLRKRVRDLGGNLGSRLGDCH